jgi:hypothetical protein
LLRGLIAVFAFLAASLAKEEAGGHPQGVRLPIKATYEVIKPLIPVKVYEQQSSHNN